METVLDCCDWLINADRKAVSGRNFSVVFDKWGSDPLIKKLLEDPNMYKLRRNGNDWKAAMNNKFREEIVDMVCRGRDGHIPSSFSIIDIISILYQDFLKFDSKNPLWNERDYFILSKGHGCLALYVVLREHGFLTDHDIEKFCKNGGILGEHPDSTKVPGVEACTGSLGHGLAFCRRHCPGASYPEQREPCFCSGGDGECHEGTIWEAANVAVIWN